MKRREFIAVTAALLASSPRLQAQGTPRCIGLLTPFLDQQGRDAWHNGLREKGWIEGRNLIVEYRYYAEMADRIPELARELVALKPDVLVALGPREALALKSATAIIPIIFVYASDPVELGLVQSLSHPGGNITGLTSVVPGNFLGKQLEILREMVPGASKIALLVNPRNPMHRLAINDELPRAARNLNLALPVVEAIAPEELDTAFAAAAAQHADGISVFADPLTTFEAPRVVALAAKHRLPAMYLFRQFADGGLVVYGPDMFDLLRRAGGYVDKILKGTMPSVLPVEQPVKFDLVINMKTAKALGLTVPPSLLARADEVIE